MELILVRQKEKSTKEEKNKKRDYHIYIFNWKDWIEYGACTLFKSLIICYLFYDSYKAVFLFIPFAILDYRNMKDKKSEQQKMELALQFKAVIESLVTSLNAGYSLEHAFADAKRDLGLVYDKNALIFKELELILQGLKINIPIEQLLKSFAERSAIEDIRNFANVLAVAKRSGGNLIRIIGKTVNSISDKLAVEEEIKTIIAAKKLEERIMILMPYGIILYLRMTSGEFLNVLYHNTFGIILMTAFLAVIYAADLWAKKIMEIHV